MKPKWWQFVKRFRASRKRGKTVSSDANARTALTTVTTFEELVAVVSRDSDYEEQSVQGVDEGKPFWKHFWNGAFYLMAPMGWLYNLLSDRSGLRLFEEYEKEMSDEGAYGHGEHGMAIFFSSVISTAICFVFSIPFAWIINGFLTHYYVSEWALTPFVYALFVWISRRQHLRFVREREVEKRNQITPSPAEPVVVNERILAFVKRKIEEHKNVALGEQSRITALFAKSEKGLGRIIQLQARYQERAKTNPTKWEPKLRTLSAFEGRLKMQRESLTRQKDSLLKFFARCETTLDPLRVQLEERLDAEEIETIGREIVELETEVPTIGFDTVREIIGDFVRLNGALETAGSIAGQIGGVDFDLTDAVAHEPVVLDALDRLQMDLLPAPIEMT